MSFSVPKTLEAELDEITTHYPEKRSASLMYLHAFQEHFGHVSREAMDWTASRLGLRPIHIYELVTFYPMFRQEPVGATHVKVCRTLSCALAGAVSIRTRLCEKLGLDPHAHVPQTTPDGRYTVEFVECLAACGSAPVAMVNEELVERVPIGKPEELLARGGSGGVEPGRDSR